jgi:hypothetical protein
MIVVYTDYDYVAKVLGSYARKFVADAVTYGRVVTHNLGPRASNGASVRGVLARAGKLSLFFFGHGDEPPPCLWAQDQVPFIDASNAHHLTNRLVFANCCYSLDGIAALTQAHLVTILGYWGELAVIDRPNTRYPSLFEECYLAGPRTLLAGGTVIEARDATVQSFKQMARKMRKTNNVTDYVMSLVLLDPNAAAHNYLGNPTLTL